jgi:hemolysin III
MSFKNVPREIMSPRPKHKPNKPVLRGVSHAFAALASAVGAMILWYLSKGDRARQLSLLVFGLSLVALYGSSAAYHIGRWTDRSYMFFRRLDHSMIFILIAGTYTPFGFNFLYGSGRILTLALIWGVAIVGVGLKMFSPFLARRASVPLYLGTGWLALFMSRGFIPKLPGGALGLIFAGGTAYTVGAVIYALKSPNPLPGVFGYHEVFHLLVIAGSLAHFLAVLLYVVPVVQV